MTDKITPINTEVSNALELLEKSPSELAPQSGRPVALPTTDLKAQIRIIYNDRKTREELEKHLAPLYHYESDEGNYHYNRRDAIIVVREQAAKLGFTALANKNLVPGARIIELLNQIRDENGDSNAQRKRRALETAAAAYQMVQFTIEEKIIELTGVPEREVELAKFIRLREKGRKAVAKQQKELLNAAKRDARFAERRLAKAAQG